jgi:CheY-like chemotaxis protein
MRQSLDTGYYEGNNTKSMTRVIHIMAVEDDWLDQLEVKRSLERRGILHRLTIAYNGAAAIKQLEAFSQNPEELPDIILLDLNLPLLSGMEVYNRIRQHEEWNKIKVFILTGSARLEEMALIDQPGISGVITKPLRLENPSSISAFNLMIDLMNI